VGTAKDIYLSPKNIPLKWAELVSVGIAFSMKNEFCAKVHMENAHKAGATVDEIWDTMLIANIMAVTNINSMACRLIEAFEEVHKDEP
jgi:AhpD family alkylhydroperoxidase